MQTRIKTLRKRVRGNKTWEVVVRARTARKENCIVIQNVLITTNTGKKEKTENNRVRLLTSVCPGLVPGLKQDGSG